MFGIFRRTKIRTPYGYGARAPLPPIPQGRSWGKETPLTDEIRITPPPPRSFCECDLRYGTFRNTNGELSCKECGRLIPTFANGGIIPFHEQMGQCGITMQQAKERMKMNCGHPAAEKDFCPQCSYEAKISQYTNTGADELTRLQSLLSTPNLSQSNIDEINAQISTLLAKKRGAEKTGEVWLDDRK